jgi:myosin heavy subunit
MQRALDVLGFAHDEKHNVFTLSAAVMLLGQMRFKEAGADACIVDGMHGRNVLLFMSKL